jgi:hypothetical protein
MTNGGGVWDSKRKRAKKQKNKQARTEPNKQAGTEPNPLTPDELARPWILETTKIVKPRTNCKQSMRFVLDITRRVEDEFTDEEWNEILGNWEPFLRPEMLEFRLLKISQACTLPLEECLIQKTHGSSGWESRTCSSMSFPPFLQRKILTNTRYILYLDAQKNGGLSTGRTGEKSYDVLWSWIDILFKHEDFDINVDRGEHQSQSLKFEPFRECLCTRMDFTGCHRFSELGWLRRRRISI